MGLKRRLALAFQRKPGHAEGPSASLRLREVLALPRLLLPSSHPPVERARHPKPVVLLPGFFSIPVLMRPLLRALLGAGHSPQVARLTSHGGITLEKLTALARQVEAARKQGRGKVTLIGWSLGGLYAREVARMVPEAVGLVVTMGTPFS